MITLYIYNAEFTTTTDATALLHFQWHNSAITTLKEEYVKE